MDGRAHTRNISLTIAHTLSLARTNPGWLSPQDPPDQGRGAWWAFAPVAAAIGATLVWIILCLPPAT